MLNAGLLILLCIAALIDHNFAMAFVLFVAAAFQAVTS